MRISLKLLLATVAVLTFAVGLAFAWPSAHATTLEPERPCCQRVDSNGERKNRAVELCYQSGGIPALGFDFAVVCIGGKVVEYDPASDEWRDPVGDEQ